MFICEHCSILTTDHLSQVCKNRFSDSQSADLQLHRTKCTNIIKNILAPHFYQELVGDIGDQEYSILIDESTDVSVSKLLGVTVRYFSLTLKKIVSTFLGLVELEDGTANGIVNGLNLLLSGLNLNIKNIIGIGTDNATVMTGTTNGVHQLLKTITGKDNLVLVRCVCHSLQLAMSHASKQTLPRNIDFLIRETYNWFSHSSKRQMYYKDIKNYDVLRLPPYHPDLNPIEMAWAAIKGHVAAKNVDWNVTRTMELIQEKVNFMGQEEWSALQKSARGGRSI